MAEQGWTTHLAAAAGVAAGAGAAQLGVGYGLGIVVWPTESTTGDTVWLASLAWAVWIAAGSTVLGAVAALRLRAGAQPELRAGALARLALVVAAAVGALLTVVLIALPARVSIRDDTYSPQIVAAGYATLGVLLGLAIAWWAAASRPVAANVLATSGWLWVLAVVAVVTGLLDLPASGAGAQPAIGAQPATGVQLGSWRMTVLGDQFYYGTIYWPGALLALLAALVIGALAAWPAVRRGDRGIGVAASGAVGPLLVAAAYFTLAAQLTGARGLLESAYLISPYTVLAGLAGSALAVTLGSKTQNHDEVRRQAPRRKTSSRTAAPGSPAAPTPAPPAAVGAGDSATGWRKATAGPAKRRASRAVAAQSAPARTVSARSEPARSASAQPAPDGPAPRWSLFGRRATSGRSADAKPGRPARATGRVRLPIPRIGSTPPPTGQAADPIPPAASTRAAGSTPPSSTAKPRKSTVKPPPANPPVATINSARPADPRPARLGTAGATEDATPSSDAADRPPARTAPAKTAAKPTGTSARKATRPSKASTSAPTNAEPPGPTSSDTQPARRTAGDTEPATAGSGDAGGRPATAAPTAARTSGAPAKTADTVSVAGSQQKSAVTAALADTTPLWVDDPDKNVESDPDRDGLKGRLRRLGRRPSSTPSRTPTTFDPDTEPPA